MAANQTQITIAAVDATKQAFQSVQNNLNGLSGSLRTVAGLLATTFAGFSLGRVVTETAQYSKEVSRLAQVSGLGVEQFQALGYASERVGISQEKLGDIFKDVGDKVGDFLDTGGGGMADFFEKIAPQVGVTAEQFRKLNGADALQLYVSSLEKANVSQNQMNFYMEAIASEASYLLPLLQNNGAAMKMLGEEANELGVILNRDAIKQAKELSDNLDRMKAVFTSVGRVLGNFIIPYLNTAAEYFLALNRVVSSEGGVIETFKKFFGFVGDGAANRTQMFEDLEKNLEAIRNRTEALSKATEIIATVESNGQNTREKLNLITEQLTERNKELVDVYNKTRPAVDLLNDELADAERLYQANNISLEQYLTLLEQANEKYEQSVPKTSRAKNALHEYAEAAKDLNKSLQNAAMNGVKQLEDSLVGVFMGTMSVKDAFKSMAASIISDLIRIQIQRSITGPLSDALGSMFRAQGGSVTVGKPYIVGEKGPEMFVPSSSGAIVPNNRLGGAGAGDTVVVNQTINLSAGVSQTVRAEVMNMMPRIMEATKGAVADAKRRGGTFAKAFA